MIILAIAALLFGLAFITKRRFGVLGLALCAGLVLSGTLPGLGNVISSMGVVVPGVHPDVLAESLLILLPSLVLVFGGPRYQPGIIAIISSILYAAFAIVLLLGPLGDVLDLDATGERIVEAARGANTLLLSGLVVLSLIDVILMRTPAHHGKGKKH